MKNFIVRQACLQDLTYIDFLQKKNAEELAFFPKQVFEREIPLNRVVLAEYNNEPCGYLYYGAFSKSLKIHQACIQYDLRGKLYGAALVGNILNKAEKHGVSSIHLRCGSDIEANGFWKTMGFYCEAIQQGGVRRMREINCWRHDLQPALFTTVLTPSSKKKDPAIWRKGKGKGNKMLRGKAMKEYRDKVIKKAEEAIDNNGVLKLSKDDKTVIILTGGVGPTAPLPWQPFNPEERTEKDDIELQCIFPDKD